MFVKTAKLTKMIIFLVAIIPFISSGVSASAATIKFTNDCYTLTGPSISASADYSGAAPLTDKRIIFCRPDGSQAECYELTNDSGADNVTLNTTGTWTARMYSGTSCSCTAGTTIVTDTAVVQSTPCAATGSTATYGLTNKPLKDIINGITEWVLGIAAGLAILYLVWGGIYYVTASGDESQIEDAKRIIKYALIGLFVIGISYGVVVTLDNLIR